MEMTENIPGLPVAFLAGLLSFLSPCVLALVPAYLGYLSGCLLTEGAPDRWKVFRHALVFVGTFSAAFIILFGLPTSFLAGVLQRYQDWIARLGGAILILFGLHTARILHVPVLNRSLHWAWGRNQPASFTRSMLIGLAFALGWTPCIGPLLGTAITLALTAPGTGVLLILAYALGLALPFLLSALMWERALGWLSWFRRHGRWLELASGAFMIGIGILLVLDRFSELSRLMNSWIPSWVWQWL